MNLATVHATPWTAAQQAFFSFTIFLSLLKLMSIESVMPSIHLILCHHPLPLLPSIFPSIRIFSNELALWSVGQRIGASASAPVLSVNIQDWFPLGFTGLISLSARNSSVHAVYRGTHLLPFKVCDCAMLSRLSRVRLCVTPQMAAHQDPPSLRFSRQEHWSGLPFPSPMHESEKWKWSRSVVSNSPQPHGLQPTRLLRPWDFPGKSAGVGYHWLVVIN